MQDARPESFATARKVDALLNAMSVDIEDWFQVGAFESVIDRADWDRLEHRVERNTHAVLSLFDEAGIKATFFILGWVAERYPALMQQIVAAGHEIANHGYDHARVHTLSPDQFRADLDRSRKLLEDTSGQKVIGYRAPSFSIDQRTPWAHEILAEQGYAYSSSVAPIHHDHYGWAGSPRFAWKPVAQSDFIELPVTTVKLGGRTLAAGGGGFFRLLPYMLYRQSMRKMQRDDGHGAIFYFHPWEIDPEQPRVKNAPIRSKIRHYTNLKVMRAKLLRAGQDFNWGRVDELAALEAGLMQ
ncbi:MAG: polysaccharide deacetylase family protein (PEP-CTERM system associated) [Parasphingorhabdus sp.]|jgi:polysaccharide deacetylase family protein (PEP-CTERM system associated)|uniref:XrtA system polysaccharide deacetylase n=1 Tax=Parasphingorhabdus sp. TaxID=2709688 RepID=UPI0039E43F45